MHLFNEEEEIIKNKSTKMFEVVFVGDACCIFLYVLFARLMKTRSTKPLPIDSRLGGSPTDDTTNICVRYVFALSILPE